MSEKIINVSFISTFDRTRQTYLMQKPINSKCCGIFIYLHGATNHQEQGFDREIFNGTFARLQDFLYESNYVYVCPEYRGDSWMNEPAESDMKQLIGFLKEKFNTVNIFIAGGSMGGTGSLIFTARNTHLVSGVLALCPATDITELYFSWSNPDKDFLARTIESAYEGDPEKVPDEYRRRSAIYLVERFHSIPLAIIHGDADMLIPVEHSRSFVKKAIDCGIRIFYREIKGGDHDSPVKDFNLIKEALIWIMSIKAR
ncbi:MAG: prolyl oligopeptidase family serine peptidase [Candidatus Omnitrophica bacterium]|nr:prolyl oligopeptidase family serine peptidase [Candidatus Omnitrophota bacterium]